MLWLPEDPIEVFAIAVGPEAGDREFNRMIAANQALCNWLDGIASDQEICDLISDCNFDPYEHIQDGLDYLAACQR